VKLAEDGSGDVVVRLYEALGVRATGRISAAFAAESAIETDLLEREVAPRAVTNRTVAGSTTIVDLALRPFEIVTLRLAR
jgi:alpha-mannosidase